MGVRSLRDATRDLIDKSVTAVATHVHLDHVGGHHEFEECLVHRLEAEGLRRPTRPYSLIGDGFDPWDLASMALPVPGYEIAGPMLTALPHAGYDLAGYRLRPARVTREVEEGDRVDTGDRSFEVLHLPGHSPGGIGLWEADTGILFSGDAIYDGPLLDELELSSVPEYVKTMRRLRELPVRVVHAGHEPSFGRDRLVELVDEYLSQRETQP
jgi:glyoxylase-like metal-dependent hydrolase (beta-lactamase superfamily II)